MVSLCLYVLRACLEDLVCVYVCAQSRRPVVGPKTSIEMQVAEPLEDSGCVFSALQVGNPSDTKCIPIKLQDTPTEMKARRLNGDRLNTWTTWQAIPS